jgi:hypothetical protein
MTPHTYRLASNVRVFLAFFGVFFLVVVGLIVSQLAREGWPAEAAILVVWLGFAAALFSHAAFRSIIAITLEDDAVVFRSLFRSTRLLVSELVTIETSWWDLNRFSPVIRHRRGKLRLLGPFDGFYELISRLKEMNPAIEVKRL